MNTILYVCAGCGKVRCRMQGPMWDWLLASQKPCGRCKSCTIRPQRPNEVVYSKSKRRRPDRQWRRQRRLAITFKQWRPMRTKAVTKKFSAASSTTHYEVSLPAGLRIREITEGSTKGKFFLDEFPADLFPPNSMIRHDAEHYGIILEPNEVEIGIYHRLSTNDLWELNQAAKTAIEAQSACNLIAVIGAMHKAMQLLARLSIQYVFPGTDWVNTHPIVRLYASKILHLSQYQNRCMEYSEASDYVEKLATGQIDGITVQHKYQPT